MSGGTRGQTPAGFGGSGGMVIAGGTVAAGEEGKSGPPPSDKGVKTCMSGQCNVLSPKVKRRGPGHFGFFRHCQEAMGTGG